MSDSKTIVLAAGGTGGHIFPAEALAAELIAKNYSVILVTDRRYKKHHSTPEAMQVRQAMSASPSGNLIKKVTAALCLVAGVVQARYILKKIKPDVVVGFGGYPSFPAVMAASTLKIKTIIHEQNCVLGRVNRLLAPRVDVIATAFPEVRGMTAKSQAKVVLTGNPVRPAIRAIKDFPYPGVGEHEHVHVLVVGGSQGASIFSEVVPAAILSLPEAMQKRIRLDQQCRKEDLEKVQVIYTNAGIHADLATFFEDMPSRLAAAHLVITRSGASTVAELTVAGKPSILVPYMYATDDHQTANARAIEKRGAALVIPQQHLTPEVLAQSLRAFIEDPEKLQRMAINAFDLGRGDAVAELARLVG